MSERLIVNRQEIVSARTWENRPEVLSALKEASEVKAQKGEYLSIEEVYVLIEDPDQTLHESAIDSSGLLPAYDCDRFGAVYQVINPKQSKQKLNGRGLYASTSFERRLTNGYVLQAEVMINMHRAGFLIRREEVVVQENSLQPALF